MSEPTRLKKLLTIKQLRLRLSNEKVMQAQATADSWRRRFAQASELKAVLEEKSTNYIRAQFSDVTIKGISLSGSEFAAIVRGNAIARDRVSRANGRLNRLQSRLAIAEEKRTQLAEVHIKLEHRTKIFSDFVSKRSLKYKSDFEDAAEAIQNDEQNQKFQFKIEDDN